MPEPPTPPSRGEADLFLKTAQDKVVVLRTRQWCIYPFRAEGWTDLRVGLFLSLTKKEDPPGPPPIDDVTGLADTIGDDDVTVLPARDRYWIGVKTAVDAMPGSPGVIFAGFTNVGEGATGRSILSASDDGTGVGTDFWWPHNGGAGKENVSAIMLQEANRAVFSPPGLQQHFPGPGAVGDGYAVMLGLRFRRPNANSRFWTMEVKTDGTNADMDYSSTPTEELLVSKLQAWPEAVQMGPIELANFVPDALYAYWPFALSRLRIHSVAVYKAGP